MKLAHGSLAFSLLLGSLPSGLAAVDGRRLSSSRELVASQEVSLPTLSPDGIWLVYVDLYSVVGSTSLFAVPTDKSTAPILLAISPISTSPLFSPVPLDLRISPDSRRVLFRGRSSATDPRLRLYQVPIDGSGPAVDLTGTLGDVTNFVITPDSTHVVVRADFFTVDRFLLWSLPITGGAVLEESGPVTAGADVEEYALTPDGTRVVYRADATTNGWYELHTAPLGAVSGSTRLDPLGSTAEVEPRFVITNDGARVVYRCGPNLQSSPVDGSAPATLLNRTAGSNCLEDFTVSADGTQVAYRAPEPIEVRLFSVPSDGSAGAIPLTPTLPSTADVYSDMAITPDGGRVVYRSDALVDERVELFSVPTDGSLAPVRLHSDLPPGHTVLADFAITLDGTRVAFNAGVLVDSLTGPGQLFLAPVDGAAGPLLLDSLAALRTQLTFAPAGRRLVYSRRMGNAVRLCSVPLDGSSAAVELSSGVSLGDFELFASRPSVLYLSDDEVAGTRNVYTRRRDGTGPRVQLTPDPPQDTLRGSVSNLLVSGKRAVFVERGTGLAPAGLKLYSVPIAGGTPISLADSIDVRWEALTSQIRRPEIDSSERVVFLGHRTDNVELFSVPVKGGAPPVALSGPMQVGGGVSRFELTNDRATVLYFADSETEGILDLYRVPSDGSSPAVKLSALPDTLTRLEDPSASTNGARVLYGSIRQSSFAPVWELYCADGLGPPVMVSSGVGAGLWSYSISDDGAWAFWITDANVDDQFELFRAPSDGSGIPVRLSGTLVPAGDVSSFLVTPDATRVVFIANAEGLLREAVYSVLADGSAPRQRLTPGVSNTSASSLLLTPDRTQVLFEYAHNPEPNRLWLAPIDGSVAATPLSPPYVEDAQLTADGTRVVYRVYAGSSGLYSSRLDATGDPILLDSQKADPFLVSPDSQRVVYIKGTSPFTFPYALFDVPIDGTSVPRALTTTLDPQLSVDTFLIARNSTAVVYTQSSSAGIKDLYAVSLDRVAHPSMPLAPR